MTRASAAFPVSQKKRFAGFPEIALIFSHPPRTPEMTK
jgi:hypothetical protein